MVTVLPLALSMIIMNTGPMFTWLMTVFKFNAKVNKGDVIVAFLCFLSLILIGGSDILYHLIHGDLQKVLGEGQHWSEYVLKLVCVGIMIVGWILWACVRRVKDCYSIIINFHFGIQCWV
jgi:drug/metabolite transporter (DMT)-like permease